jgi:Holliday junction resolvase RusA-like endonuclease
MGTNSDHETTHISPTIYIIPGKPIPLARPRHSKHSVYDPQKDIKEEVAWQLLRQRKKPFSLVGPLELNATFYMPIPKSTSKKNRAALANQPHPIKPDLDNLIKFILDVASGLLYKDDKSIAAITARKLYSEEPRTLFTLRKL